MDTFNWATSSAMEGSEAASGDKIMIRDVSVTQESDPGGLKYMTLGNLMSAQELVGVEAITATADGTGTGTISSDTTRVTVTSSDANHIVVLPAPIVGKLIVLHVVATGYELRTSAPATIGINGGTGASAESAIGANVTAFLYCATLTSWKGWQLGSDGTLAKVEVAA